MMGSALLYIYGVFRGFIRTFAPRYGIVCRKVSCLTINKIHIQI